MEISDKDPLLPPSLSTKYNGRLIHYLVSTSETMHGRLKNPEHLAKKNSTQLQEEASPTSVSQPAVS